MSFTAPVPIAETVNVMEAAIMRGLRPYRSDRTPATMTPIKQPRMALPITHPCMPGELAIPKKTS